MKGTATVDIYSLGQPFFEGILVNFQQVFESEIEFTFDSENLVLINESVFLSKTNPVKRRFYVFSTQEETIERAMLDILELFYRKGSFVLYDRSINQRFFFPNGAISMIKYSVSIQ